MIALLTQTLNGIYQSQQATWSRSDWTGIICRTLCALGQSNGFEAYSHGSRNEWLFDIAWLETDKEKNLISMPLAVEIEWGTDSEISDDFMKLMVARSQYKWMIFGENNISTEITIDMLQAQARAYLDNRGGDKYLLSAYEGSTVGFRHWLLSGDGFLRSLT